MRGGLSNHTGLGLGFRPASTHVCVGAAACAAIAIARSCFQGHFQVSVPIEIFTFTISFVCVCVFIVVNRSFPARVVVCSIPRGNYLALGFGLSSQPHASAAQRCASHSVLHIFLSRLLFFGVCARTRHATPRVVFGSCFARPSLVVQSTVIWYGWVASGATCRATVASGWREWGHAKKATC